MANGLPGIGEISEPEEKKESTEKKGFLNGWVDWPKIVKAVIGLVVLVGGSFSGYQIYSERQPMTTDTAMAAEIEKVKGDVKAVTTVTEIVQKNVESLATRTEDIQTKVDSAYTATEVLKTDVGNLKETVKEVKDNIKKLDDKQDKLQEGINKILQKLK